MCGITGYLNFNHIPARIQILKLMTDAIAHRGPDGEGQWADGPIGLGHRRLAILDTSDLGTQPMITKDKRFILSYNGEIYNHLEIRKELELKGEQFQSRCDTEVLLKAFAHWGVDCLEKLNGMFAFAVWDQKERKLTLARDRYGIKPVYYYYDGLKFIFGSEVKAILAYPEIQAKLNLQGLREYFTFQNFFTNQTLFQNILLLDKGSYLEISLDNRQLKKTMYWDYVFKEDYSSNQQEATEEVTRLFKQAVRRQLMSDVPLGSYLSGGMDSGSITAIASQYIPNLNTFTIGFDKNSISGLELSYDERSQAEYMSYLFQTEHYEMVLKSGDLERCMSNLVYHLEEPRTGQSYPNFYASKLSSKFVKVVLAGTGGDELFGGYPWRYYRAVVNSNFEHYIDKYYEFWQRLISNSIQQKVFAPIWDDIKDTWTRDIMKNVFCQYADQLTKPEDYIQHSLYFEANTFLEGLLIMEDKLSMAHGMESRVPFLDNDLVDYTIKIPVKYKLGNLKNIIFLNENESGIKIQKYFQKTKDGKLILREAMNKILPSQITQAIKQGFSAPDSSWFRGDSIDYIQENLFNKNARLYTYMDYTETTNLINDHLKGRQNRRLLIWSLLYFEEFLKTFIK